MSQQKSITISKPAPGLFEIKGCTYPHIPLFKELGCEWQGRALCWMWKGDKLPTALQQLADGVYGLEALKAVQTSVLGTSTPKTPEMPIAPKPEQKTAAKSKAPKPKKVKAEITSKVKPAVEFPIWEIGYIKVTTKNQPITVPAQIYGTIAIHMEVLGEDSFTPDAWGITHIESGLLVFRTKRTFIDGTGLRSLAETLHSIDIKQFWLDKEVGVVNIPLGNQVKKAVQGFLDALKVAETVKAEGDI